MLNFQLLTAVVVLTYINPPVVFGPNQNQITDKLQQKVHCSDTVLVLIIKSISYSFGDSLPNLPLLTTSELVWVSLFSTSCFSNKELLLQYADTPEHYRSGLYQRVL